MGKNSAMVLTFLFQVIVILLHWFFSLDFVQLFNNVDFNCNLEDLILNHKSNQVWINVCIMFQLRLEGSFHFETMGQLYSNDT